MIASAWVVAFASMGAAAVVVPDQEPILRLPRLAAPAPVLKTPHHRPGPVIAEVVGPSPVRPSLRLTELRVAAVAAVRPLVTPEAAREPARRDTPETAAAQPKRDTPAPAAKPAKPVQPKPRPWPRLKPQPDPGGEQNPGGEEQGGETGSGDEESNNGGGEPTSGGEENNGGGNSGGEHTERKHPVRDLVKHVIGKAKDSKSKRSTKGDSNE